MKGDTVAKDDDERYREHERWRKHRVKQKPQHRRRSRKRSIFSLPAGMGPYMNTTTMEERWL